MNLSAFAIMPLALDREARDYVMTSKPPDYILRRCSDDVAVCETWLLWDQMGRAVELQRLLAPDDPGCFHTTRRAMRMVIEGSYTEEVYQGGFYNVSAGHFGEIRRTLRRVHALPGPCISIWWRSP